MIKLENNERIIKVVRKHWFSIVSDLFFVLLMAVAPAVFLIFFNSNIFQDIVLKNFELTFFLYCVYLIFVWIISFVVWINYYLDIWVITNYRLVSVDQKTLFSREISSLRLENIQDVRIEVNGLIATFLRIGNIHVKTAASASEFIIYKANDPEDVKQIIMQAYGEQAEKARVVLVENNVTQKPPQANIVENKTVDQSQQPIILNNRNIP